MIKIKNNFLKSITILISGSILGQIVNFITAPVMTRFFSSEDIGIYTYITTIAYVFSPILCLRYETAIVLEEDEDNIFAILKFCFISTFFLSIFIILAYTFYFSCFSGNKDILKYINLIFILLLISGIINIFTSYNNKEKEYVVLSKAPIYKSIAQLVGIICFGVIKWGSFGLILSHLLSQIANFFQQGKSIILKTSEIISADNKTVAHIIKKYYALPLFSVPAIFCNNLSYLSLNFIIGSMYGMEILGYYSLSFRILGVPLSLISQNIGTVFFEKAAQDYIEKKSFKNSFIETGKLLVAITIPLTFFIYYFAPVVCRILFGESWIIAGEYIRILIIMFAIRFVASPLTAGILVLKKNKIELLCQFCFCIISLGAYAYAQYIFPLDIETFLYIISVGFSVVYLFFLYIIYKFS